MTTALAILAGLVAGLWARVKLREIPVDGALRNAAPGHCVGLSEGVTHYRLEGSETGPLIFCIHGLSTPSPVYDGLAAAWVAKGHRVLRYDLYGRGYSDRPRGAYDAARYLRQADELLAALGIEGPMTVVGYSMGGCLGAAFADAHPDRVARLVLLAPGGFGVDLGRFLETCAKLPVVGDWVFESFGGMVLRKAALAEDTAKTSVPDLTCVIVAETMRRGYMRAVLSSVRRVLGTDLTEVHARLAVPVLAIWGEADTVIPLSAMDRMAAANPAARHVVVPGAGHGLPYTHTDAVLEAMG
jgi:pimeloyl-ACP methyl ester carboxylesterase